jgi:hypothetical protein
LKDIFEKRNDFSQYFDGLYPKGSTTAYVLEAEIVSSVMNPIFVK